MNTAQRTVDDDLRNWVAAYLTGTLSPTEAQPFNKRLHDDPSARIYFAQQAKQDVLLRECLEARSYAQERTDQIVRRDLEKKQRKAQRRRTPRRQARKQNISSMPMFGAAAVAAAIFIAVFWLLQTEAINSSAVERNQHLQQQGDLKIIRGRVAVGAQTYKAQDHIAAGQSLRAASEVVLEHIDDASRIVLRSSSAARFSRNAQQNVWHLDQGRITCQVTSQANGQLFVVRAQLAEVRVVGTVFNVDVSTRRMAISVSEGTVEVLEFKNNLKHMLHAGDSLELHADQQQPAVPADEEERLQQQAPIVQSFSLVDAESDQVIPGYAALRGDIELDSKQMSTQLFNLRINLSQEIDYFIIHINGVRKKEQYKPFTVFSDTEGDYKGERLRPRRYDITVQAYKDGQTFGELERYSVVIK